MAYNPTLSEGIAMMRLLMIDKQMKEAKTFAPRYTKIKRGTNVQRRSLREAPKAAGRGVTKGAGSYKSANQKLNYMLRGMQDQADIALDVYERKAEIDLKKIRAFETLRELTRPGSSSAGGELAPSNIYTPGGGGNIGDFFQQLGTGRPGALKGNLGHKGVLNVNEFFQT
jgi:hypothetical protein